MGVGRREFAWVFPQLSLLGQTSSESYMRVDESLFSFFDFLLFLVASTFLFLRFLTLVKLLTVEVITPTVTFFLLWVMTWKSLASATLYTTLGQLSSPVKRATLIKIWTSSKLISAWELMRLLAVKREESCDSIPLSSSPLVLQLLINRGCQKGSRDIKRFKYKIL